MKMRIESLYGCKASWLLWSFVALLPLSVRADTSKTVQVYDRMRGELSPGTQAPTLEQMMNSIRSASPTALTATLEYGQRVECLECIPLLEAKLLDSGTPKVREMAAWWLRQRPFGYGRAAVAMRRTVLEDADATRRSRAAEALGEFLDVRGLPALERAAMEDKAPEVRLAAVRALGRLNAPEGHAVLAAAFGDTDAAVRRAALDQVLQINALSDTEPLVARLRDDDAQVRLRAAQLAGQLRIATAADGLTSILRSDQTPAVRQSAAWALGRIGGAQQALHDAHDKETDPGVLDAIDVALRMK